MTDAIKPGLKILSVTPHRPASGERYELLFFTTPEREAAEIQRAANDLADQIVSECERIFPGSNSYSATFSPPMNPKSAQISPARWEQVVRAAAERVDEKMAAKGMTLVAGQMAFNDTSASIHVSVGRQRPGAVAPHPIGGDRLE